MATVIEPLPFIATLPGSSHRILVRPAVLVHMDHYKQTSFWKREAGGQLFAKLTDAHLDICLATGPYRGDYRSRFGFRSRSSAAQREILRQRSLGLYYCGDWHTHPQRIPRASPEDFETIAKLHDRSDLRLGTVLMLIQGTETGPTGLSIYSSNTAETVQWRVEVADPGILPTR